MKMMLSTVGSQSHSDKLTSSGRIAGGAQLSLPLQVQRPMSRGTATVLQHLPGATSAASRTVGLSGSYPAASRMTLGVGATASRGSDHKTNAISLRWTDAEGLSASIQLGGAGQSPCHTSDSGREKPIRSGREPPPGGPLSTRSEVIDGLQGAADESA